MLVHICCAVDSHYFLEKIKSDYPNKKIIGFFYDPNIHPYSEYYLRLLEVKRSCKMLGFELIEGDYDIESWLSAVRGLEHEPEKGARCSVCFDYRFEASAKKAAELGVSHFTSTLLTSPKKSLKQLQSSGDALARKYGIEFVAPDYRKASGTQEQNILAKDAKLYRQDYCGCIHGLTIQREQQDKLADELSSPIGKQIQPGSIEEKIEAYERRLDYEKDKIEYRIVKERFLNWRLLSGIVKVRKKVISSHILPYSTLKKSFSRGKIEYNINDLYYMGRDEVKFISLNRYNLLANTDYHSVTELIFDPPKFEKEVEIRNTLISSSYDISAIIIVDEIPTNKIELIIETKAYEDVREVLLKIS